MAACLWCGRIGFPAGPYVLVSEPFERPPQSKTWELGSLVGCLGLCLGAVLSFCMCFFCRQYEIRDTDVLSLCA